VKILLADDHALFREGTRYLLRQLDEAVQVLESDSCRAAIDHAHAHDDIDLALLDLHMPGMDGIDCVVQFQHAHPAVPVVVLSGSESRLSVQAVLDIGALGYIPKSSSSQVMLSAIRLVLSGGVYLPPLLLNQETLLVDGVADAPPPCCLTERRAAAACRRQTQQAHRARVGAGRGHDQSPPGGHLSRLRCE
jgi:DNA-binding NarL/FixJ family response regulator